MKLTKKKKLKQIVGYKKNHFHLMEKVQKKKREHFWEQPVSEK